MIELKKEIKTDRRYRKNHQSIMEAYLRLVTETDPCRITVKDICDEADVNRSTFYQHFGYIESLVRDVIRERILKVCGLSEVDEYRFTVERYSEQQLRASIRNYISNFIGDEVLMAMINSERNHVYLEMIIEAHCELMESSPDDPMDVCGTLFQNAGAVSTIINWYRNGCIMPQSVLEDTILRHQMLEYELWKDRT